MSVYYNPDYIPYIHEPQIKSGPWGMWAVYENAPPPKEILTIHGGDPAPKQWLDIHNIGHFSKPTRWHRFWAWFLLGWKWDENLWNK